MNSEPSFLRRIALSLVSVSGLAILLIVTIGLRCWNYDRVFVNGAVYFVDADCYSRMTRVREMQEGKFKPGHQAFENFPEGTTSHATLPLDILILGLTELIGDRDMAGAWIGPILGALGAVFLWGWSRTMRGRWMLLGLYAISPILVHGTALGRPDHQALLIVFLTMALGGEWRMSTGSGRSWHWLTGISWGMAFWVSFYEPLVLFALVELLRALVWRNRWAGKERWVVWGGIAGVLSLALLVERSIWLRWPGRVVLEYFPRWETSIAELGSTYPWSGLLLGWTGFGLLIAPILLAFAMRRDRRAFSVLFLLLSAWGLTVWQIRWGYFLALIFVMSIPLQLVAVPNRWVAWAGFLFSLWPIASAWEMRIFPEGELAFHVREQTSDAQLLREAAQLIAIHPEYGDGGILAPWWFSPPIAYWSGYPAVAGSSHESLPGTVASAQFYLTSSLKEARKILKARQVKWVVAYEPVRVIATSARLLDREPESLPMAELLFERPHSAPEFLKFLGGNPSFKVFAVEAPKL